MSLWKVGSCLRWKTACVLLLLLLLLDQNGGQIQRGVLGKNVFEHCGQVLVVVGAIILGWFFWLFNKKEKKIELKMNDLKISKALSVFVRKMKETTTMTKFRTRL